MVSDYCRDRLVQKVGAMGIAPGTIDTDHHGLKSQPGMEAPAAGDFSRVAPPYQALVE